MGAGRVHSNEKNLGANPVNGHTAAIVAGRAARISGRLFLCVFTIETAYMKKLLAVLMAGLFAAGAFAQAPAAAPAPAPAPVAAPAAAVPAATPAPMASTKKAKSTHTAKKKSSKKVAKKKTAKKLA